MIWLTNVIQILHQFQFSQHHLKCHSGNGNAGKDFYWGWQWRFKLLPLADPHEKLASLGVKGECTWWQYFWDFFHNKPDGCCPRENYQLPQLLLDLQREILFWSTMHKTQKKKKETIWNYTYPQFSFIGILLILWCWTHKEKQATVMKREKRCEGHISWCGAW